MHCIESVELLVKFNSIVARVILFVIDFQTFYILIDAFIHLRS